VIERSATRNATLSELEAAQRQFLGLIGDVRPELHRYCARMTGSVIDGEDVVQETLARAYYELSNLREVPALRTWLFRIAHHLAVDHLRRRQRRLREQPLDTADEVPASTDAADVVLEQAESVRDAMARFLELPPAQRGCVILKDVLGHPLEEIASTLDLTVPAVKAALHRGRARLRKLAAETTTPPMRPMRAFDPAVMHYANLFNARDWDGVRSLLADDVKLDVVSRARHTGRAEVGQYFTNYAEAHDWHLAPAWLDRRGVLAVRREGGPDYVIELAVDEGRVTGIRDFNHVPYLIDEAIVEPAR
jgi:RNA polymerase sigma-70 factor (ECF subfamily)